MTTPMLFGILLKETRSAQNIKLYELAVQLGIDKGILSKIENNERMATKAQLDGIIKCLDADSQLFRTFWLSTKIIDFIKGEEYAVDALIEAQKNLHSKVLDEEKWEQIWIHLTELKNRLHEIKPNTIRMDEENHTS